MRSIDVHAHLLPKRCLDAFQAGNDWHGVTLGTDDKGINIINNRSQRWRLDGRLRWGPEERICDMDSLGVDMQVVSVYPLLYSYDADVSDATAIARETNDEIASMISGRPDRFSGLATLPMQDVGAAVAEMERAVGTLGLKGVMIDDTVNGRRFDDPEFLPFFQAAEQAGALVMFHQGGRTIVSDRIPRYHLPNTVGNLAERTLTFAHLVLGGVMDKCPNLKVLLCHGGGYLCYTVERIDDGWASRPFVRANSSQPPSAYLRRFYYDCITQSDASLRFLIDKVGADRVVLGTDWPADMCIDWPVSWLLGLENLSDDEKELILHKNLEDLLDL